MFCGLSLSINITERARCALLYNYDRVNLMKVNPEKQTGAASMFELQPNLQVRVPCSV